MSSQRIDVRLSTRIDVVNFTGSANVRVDVIRQSVTGPTGHSDLETADIPTTLEGVSTSTAVTPDGLNAALPFFDVRTYGAKGDGITNDWASIQRTIDIAYAAGGGIVIIPAGEWLVDTPIWVRSNVIVRGNGPKTLVLNNSSGISGAVFMFGVYHPAAVTNVSNKMTRDTVTIPTEGATVVTRTSFDENISVGDNVFLFNSTPAPNAQYVRRVLAISGDDITLHKPLSDLHSPLSDFFISRGAGYAVPFASATIGLEITENAGIENLAVDCPNFYWIDRGGSIDCWIKDIKIFNSAAVMYGNGHEAMTVDNVTGSFRNRFIEHTDGCRDNLYRNMRGTFIGGTPYEAADPVVWLGVGGVLDGFDITDHSIRTTGHIALTQNRVTVRNGKYRISGASTNNILQFGASRKGVTVENVTIVAAGQINGDVIRLLDTTDAFIHNVRVESTGGYNTGDCTISIQSGLTRVRVDNVTDPNGSHEYVGQTALTYVVGSHILTRLSWDSTTNPLGAATSTEALAGTVATKALTPSSMTAVLDILARGGGAVTDTRDWAQFPATSGASVFGPVGNLTSSALTVVARISQDDWASTSAAIVSKYSTSGNNRGWMFRRTSDRRLEFLWSADGTCTTRTATSIGTQLPNTPGGWLWVAGTLQPDDGASGSTCRFFTSPDGVTWTELGTAVTTAATFAVFPSATTYLINGHTQGTTARFVGNVSTVSIRDGVGAAGIIGGTEVLEWHAVNPFLSYTDIYGNAWLAAATVTMRSPGRVASIDVGGTGASTAPDARTALGLVIGTDVEAHDVDLTTIAGLAPTNDDVLQRKAGAWANRTIAQLKVDLGLPERKVVRKTADEIVNNSTTFQDDDHLQFPIAASEVWVGYMVVWVLGDATADFKLLLVGPAGSSILTGAIGARTTDAVGQVLASTSSMDFGAANVTPRPTIVTFSVVNGVTPGTFKLQWAQSVATVADTTVKAGSFLTAEKI